MLVWLKDLQSNWLSWLAVALTLVVSSTSCTLALAMLVASSGAEENPAGPVGGTVLGMALCVVVLVTLSQMRLIIAEREPVYRSWRMVGMPGWMIIAFILGQVAVVSAAAGLLGVLPAGPLLAPCVRALRSDGIPMPDIAITGQVTVIAVIVCMSAALVGALPPLRRVFRPRTTAHPAWTVVKFLLASAAIGSTVYGACTLPIPAIFSRPRWAWSSSSPSFGPGLCPLSTNGPARPASLGPMYACVATFLPRTSCRGSSSADLSSP